MFWNNGIPPRNTDSLEALNRDYSVGNVAKALQNDPTGHPCPRPQDTMRHIVSIASLPGMLLVDPFAGSGTTLLAAKNLGRRAIGIELEERYCEIAAKRLSEPSLLDYLDRPQHEQTSLIEWVM